MKTAYFFLAVLLVTQCKSQQYSLENLPDKQLIFGKGGGITGAIDTYILLENGQLFSLNSITNEKKELSSISKKKTKKLFEQLSLLELPNQKINQPGNMYYFIEEANLNTSHKIIWGSNDYQIDTTYTNFYNKLTAHLN